MQALDNLPATDVVREENVVSAEYHKVLILADYLGCCIGSHCFACSALSVLLFLLSLASLSISLPPTGSVCASHYHAAAPIVRFSFQVLCP